LLLALTATSFAVRDPEVVYLREDVPSNPSTANSSGTNLEQSNNLPAPSTSTNNQNINIELERCLNLTKTDFKSALKSCLTAAESGNGMANYQVGYIYEQYFKDSKKARPFFEKAIALGYIDGYVGIAADLIAKKKYKEAIIELLKAENAGSRNSSNLIGLAYEKLGDLDSALKYYLKSSNYGEVLSSYNAGMIYYTRKQFDNAIKYFTIAGNKNDAPSMYQLGVIYREVKNDLTSSCTWFKRGLDASDSRSQQAWKDFCNEDFKVTAGEASDVKFFSLNEAPFLGGSMYHFIWVGSTEKLLDFTGIQVRPKGRTDVPWIQVPHRLQKRSEATYALVDELFLNIATKQSNICWDFRTVKEVQGKLNTIWTYLPASGCT
jgi:TPR repeat protein